MRIEKYARGVTPGLKLIVYSKGKKKLSRTWGNASTYYDWASVTKPVFTISAVMKLFEKDPSVLNQKISEILPWMKKNNVRVYQLLNHTSGYAWWKPYYKSIDKKGNPQDRWISMRKLLRRETPRAPRAESVYSDLNYFILGCVLEELYNKPLIEIWHEIKKDLGFKKTDFNLNNKIQYPRKMYAPTEKCRWRKKRMWGEVHDENTWALGGISTHSGLFGPVEELAQYVLLLRSIYKGKKGFVKSSTLKKFFRLTTRGESRWSLGFMMPALKESSAGDFLSKKSIGFLGFTGTSFWFDPVNDFFVVLLTNRVYYGRKKTGIMDLRRSIHNECFKNYSRKS